MIYRLSSYHGGLGDELQFTTLPEMLTNAGHEVYLLDDPASKQVMKPRNNMIKEFVWDDNPFIKGKLPGLWNAGDIPDIKYNNVSGAFIKNWEHLHGLVPKNSFPKIYRTPAYISGVDAVAELSSITLKYDDALVQARVNEIIAAVPLYCQQLVSPHQSSRIHLYNMFAYRASSIYEIWDLLCSCKLFISLNSGLHSLAAAARQYNKTMLHYCILPEKDADWILEQKKFVYPGVIYVRENEPFE